MTRRIFLGLAILACLLVVDVGKVRANQNSDLDRLVDALKFDETIEVMRAEGLRYGKEVGNDMLSETDPTGWAATIERIYDTTKMQSLIKRRFQAELAHADIGPMLRYFESPEGAEIVRLETAARRAFLDRDTEEMATGQYHTLRSQDARIIDQIQTLINDSDLVELNVMGALNSSMMFYRGLNDGGAIEMSEADMLADVWSQEENARNDAQDWLGAFLALAYQPLESVQLDAYIAFYQTDTGRVLNRAIFAAFDALYEETSYLLGLSVAQHLQSEPI